MDQMLPPQVFCEQFIMAAGRNLSSLYKAGDWKGVCSSVQLLWIFTRGNMPAVQLLIRSSNGTRTYLEVLRHASAAGAQRRQLLDCGTALLLDFVRADEACADAVVESDFARLLLQLLQSRDVGTYTRQHVARILLVLSTSKILYKDILRGAGVLDALVAVLSDAALLCDTDLVQEVLYVLLSLSDDDVVYKEYMREQGLLRLLAQLLGIYCSSESKRQLRPLAAIIVRCLHILSIDDDVIKEDVRKLGVIEMLIGQLQQDLKLTPSGAPAAPTATTPSTANSRPGRSAFSATTSPVKATAAVPSSSATASATASAVNSNSVRSSVLPPASPSYASVANGRTAVASTASAGKDDPPKPLPLHRLLAALLLPSLLPAGLAARDPALLQLLRLSPLLPLLEVDTSTRRLSLVVEATGALKSMLCDSPDNQVAAVAAGALPCLVKLLYARNLTIAGQAGEALTYLGNYRRELVEAGAVEGLTELLKDCSALARGGIPARRPGNMPLFPGAGIPREQGADTGKVWHSGTLVGRIRTGVVNSSSCLIGHHDSPAESCGFCALSSVIKALLRLMSQETATQNRFVAAGGVSVLFLLLRPELGRPHSRLAQSLISLLSLVIERNPGAQNETRFCGGMEVLCQALSALVQPGVSDIFQLRVALCAVLQKALDGNAANKLAMREGGGFAPLLSLLRLLFAPEGPRDVDDVAQLEVAVVETLAAALVDSPGNQDMVHWLGGTALLGGLATGATAPGVVVSRRLRLGALRALGLLAIGNGSCRVVVNEMQVVGHVMELIDEEGDDDTETMEVALEALSRLLVDNAHGVQVAVHFEIVSLLIERLQVGPTAHIVISAARLLRILAASDRGLQSNIGAEDGLRALIAHIDHGEHGPPPVLHEALASFTALVHDHTFNKNLARQLGAVEALGKLLRPPPSPGSAAAAHDDGGAMELAVLATAAVADLCHSNHQNQEELATEGLIDKLVALLSAAAGSSLEDAAAQRRLLKQAARAVGNAAELHASNKIIAREAGGVGALARFILHASEVPDLQQLQRLKLLPAVAAAAAAVAQLAQDCEENQRHFLRETDFLPALFRLMSVDDPSVATEAAKALEFIAVRNDIQDDADDRSDFEADTMISLVKLLARGSQSSTPVREASLILSAITALADLLLQQQQQQQQQQAATVAKGAAKGQLSKKGSSSSFRGAAVPPPAPAAASRTSSISPAMSPATSQGLPTSFAASYSADSAAPRAASLPHQGAVQLPSRGPSPSPLHSPPSGLAPLPPEGAGGMPSMTMDHGGGLAMLPELSGASPEEHGEMWQGLVGHAAPAFQRVAAYVSSGPWRPFKLQVSWMMFLLAVKSGANAELVRRLERTSLTPLAQQLENAEAYQAAALTQAPVDDPREQLPVAFMPSNNGDSARTVEVLSDGYEDSARFVDEGDLHLATADSDELAMIQQEVAMLSGL